MHFVPGSEAREGSAKRRANEIHANSTAAGPGRAIQVRHINRGRSKLHLFLSLVAWRHPVKEVRGSKPTRQVFYFDNVDFSQQLA
ncbi:MAG: hypothetical protein E6I95_11400 [Chloroflexi bacterium]|nr:MAG: hypothetical protein E6I95_11400 [Chloroflexota bacterium]